MIRGLFDLLPGEARVARSLTRRQTIHQIAGSSGVTRETVRSHVKAITAKMGTSRQAEGQGEAAGRPQGCHRTEPDLGNGLRLRPAGAGRKLRVLMVVDIFSRYSPVIDPRFSYRGEHVMQILDKVCTETGCPGTIRLDQGSEFVSRDLDLWAHTRGVVLDFSRPGKPTDNAFIEAFNGRFRTQRSLVHGPWRCPAKDGGLAQVLQ